MEVILTQDVDRLGKLGDVVSVKDGYARNYLIPKNKAKPATPENLKILDALKKKRLAHEEKVKVEASSLAERISNISLTIGMQAGEDEKLFGSVSGEAISNALAEEGVNIDKRDIIVDEPIKKLGVYQVWVKIHPEVKATLRVWVVKK